MSISAIDMHARAEVHAVAMMAAAMRATPAEAHAEEFGRYARTYVLAQGAAMTGVLSEHRHAPTASGPVVCAACGTAGACRTLRRIDGAFAAYLTGGPVGIDAAEAWRRANAWFNAGPGPRVPVMIEGSADAYLAWAVPRTLRPDARGLLVIDRYTGRLTGASGVR